MDNREILFRAIAIHGNEWVFGNYIHSKRMSGRSCEYRIVDKDTGLESDIIPETLGQFTGKLDINGNKVFEGDKILYNNPAPFNYVDCIIKYESANAGFVLVYLYNDCSIHELYVKGEIGSLFIPSDNIEVIGTIHDHLLKGE